MKRISRERHKMRIERRRQRDAEAVKSQAEDRDARLDRLHNEASSLERARLLKTLASASILGISR